MQEPSRVEHGEADDNDAASNPGRPASLTGPAERSAAGGAASEHGDDLTAGYDFAAAFSAYLHSYRGTREAASFDLRPLEGDDLLMKSARAIQMAENWRAQAGTWEMLGDALGRHLDADRPGHGRSRVDPYAAREGRELFRQFHVISDKEWAQMDECPPGCGSGCGDRRRQASAYEWAAEAAEANARHAEAARMFRRAGWAWEKAVHYGEAAQAPGQPGGGAGSGTRRLVRAASCYAQAAANAARTSRSPTRQMITSVKWCPACQHDKTSERQCAHAGAESPGARDEDRRASDIQRVRRVWDHVVDLAPARPGVSGRRPQPGPQAVADFDEGLRQLAMIQGLLAGQGARREAREVYRQRQGMEMDRYRSLSRARYLRKALGHKLSRNGSSLPRVLVSLSVIYLLVLPLAWLAAWGVAGVPAQPGQRFGWPPVEAVIFSLSSMVTLSNGHFAAGGWATNLAQSCQAVSSYFALGYALYVAQRSYTI